MHKFRKVNSFVGFKSYVDFIYSIEKMEYNFQCLLFYYGMDMA